MPSTRSIRTVPRICNTVYGGAVVSMDRATAVPSFSAGTIGASGVVPSTIGRRRLDRSGVLVAVDQHREGVGPAPHRRHGRRWTHPSGPRTPRECSARHGLYLVSVDIPV